MFERNQRYACGSSHFSHSGTSCEWSPLLILTISMGLFEHSAREGVASAVCRSRFWTKAVSVETWMSSVQTPTRRCELRKLIALSLLLFSTGCQCSGWGDTYSSAIDEIADCGPQFDDCYNAAYDLSRIGHPDWCCSRFNRSLCPGGCDKSCSDCR